VYLHLSFILCHVAFSLFTLVPNGRVLRKVAAEIQMFMLLGEGGVTFCLMSIEFSFHFYIVDLIWIEMIMFELCVSHSLSCKIMKNARK